MNIKILILMASCIAGNSLYASQPEQKILDEKMIVVKVQEWKPHAQVASKTFTIPESATIKFVKDTWAEQNKLSNDQINNLQIVGHNDDVSVATIENIAKKPLIIFIARPEAEGHREPYYD